MDFFTQLPWKTFRWICVGPEKRSLLKPAKRAWCWGIGTLELILYWSKIRIDSWIDGVSDWAVDNHPVIIAVERQATFNNGNSIWVETTMNNDHF